MGNHVFGHLSGEWKKELQGGQKMDPDPGAAISRLLRGSVRLVSIHV